MKIILLKEVPNLGKRGDTATVKDGYATNYLIPKGYAVMLTPGSLKALKKAEAETVAKAESKKEDAKLLAKALETAVVEFQANVGEDGKLFGTVSYKQIEDAMKAQHDIIIDKRKFIERVPVDKLGYTKLKIELYKDVIGTVTVHVTPFKK